MVADILTIGHSNRALEVFLEMLQAHGVRYLADVRHMPGSRRNPHFNREALSAALETAGVGYVHIPALGGHRRAVQDSINTGWINASFQGYADYMATPEFAAALQQLMQLAAGHRTAIMCAEAVPWRCHRSLIADALTVRGVPVHHIMSAAHGVHQAQSHALTPFARVEGGKITYPGLFGEAASEPAC